MWGDSILAGSGEMAWGFAFSPDCIRFTDFMPGLLTFDPFRVMNERTEWAKGIDSDLAGRKLLTIDY